MGCAEAAAAVAAAAAETVCSRRDRVIQRTVSAGRHGLGNIGAQGGVGTGGVGTGGSRRGRARGAQGGGARGEGG